MSRNNNTWRWLWGSLFLFQILRFLIFYGLLNSHWMNSKMLVWAILAVSADVFVIRKLMVFFAYTPVYFGPKTDSSSVNRNATFAAGISLFLPVIVLLLSDSPSRYLPDGPLQGPIAISALASGDVRGVIEFSDGQVMHDDGWGIETAASRYSSITYADPFVTAPWDPAEPVRVWVIHSQFDDPTVQRRFGYVVSWNYAQRSFWNSIVHAAMEQHNLRATQDMILVTLDTRGPRFAWGPSLMQFVFGLYFFLGLYMGFLAYALHLLECNKPEADSDGDQLE